MKAMNQIRWSPSLSSNRVYRVSERLLGDRASHGDGPYRFEKNTNVGSIGHDFEEELKVLPPRTAVVVQNLLELEHVQAVEVSYSDISVSVDDSSFLQHSVHTDCINIIHRYMWGADADVLVTQHTFLD